MPSTREPPLWPFLQRTWFHEDGQYSHYQATIHDTTAHTIFVYIASKLANTELGSDIRSVCIIDGYYRCCILQYTFPRSRWLDIAITIFINIVLSNTHNL